jgi:hypothetical protein
MQELYSFIYRGVLTEESLDKAGRRSRSILTDVQAEAIEKAMSFDLMDEERLINARRMAIVYTGIHAFENTIRIFVGTAMAEAYEEEWWDKVPNKIQSKVKTRMEEEAKFRWHGARGGTEIEYCDFGDLSSIIVTNWDIFEDVLVEMDWVKATLSILERSRNIVMHGGVLGRQDVERIGNNIRDWIRQAG